MTKRNLVLQTAVAAALAASYGSAFAGAVTLPAAATNYAVESLAGTTDITLANIVYRVDVPRTSSQDFTILYTLPAGYTFNATPAVPALNSSGAGAATCTHKRGGVGAAEVVYDCDVTAQTVVGDSVTLTAPQVANVGTTALLGTAGNSISMQVKLLENGETACVDNAGTPSTCFVSKTVAQSSNGVDLVTNAGATALGVAQDTGNTVVNVNATVPLAGFVAGGAAPADTATVAAAAVILHDHIAIGTTPVAVEPDGATDYSMKAGDTYTYTITDATGFLGLAAGGLCLDLNTSGTCTAADTLFTTSGTTATGTTTIGAAGAPNAALNVLYTSDAATPMGTGRTLGIAGSVNVPGVDHALTGNNAWWVWTSNGTVLRTPWFSTAPGYISRFAFMNTGATAATMTAACVAETGNTVGNVLPAGTSIPAGGQLVVDATSVCTFSGNTRGAVTFTINAPAGNIKGLYNIVNATSGSVSNTTLERVYAGSTF